MNQNKPSYKLLIALKEKKNRESKGFFVVEGEKSVEEVLKSKIEILEVIGIKRSLNKFKHLVTNKNTRIFEIQQHELNEVSSLKENDSILAIAKIPQVEELNEKENEIIIALDGIKDPGNLGTILRIADWYGIEKVVTSNDTVDFWNTKTISASMGSFIRVKTYRVNLFEFLENTKLPILGADMRGKNVHNFNFPKAGILVIGSESHGINSHINHLIKERITIPRFGKAESLNAGIATAVILDNWKK